MGLYDKLIRQWVGSTSTFRLFQALGVHVLPARDYYSPLVHTKELEARPEIWAGKLPTVGIDLDVPGQLAFLAEDCASRAEECRFPPESEGAPHDYFVNNRFYGQVSATVLHTLIRREKPRRILEVGSGNTTYVSARAALMNERDGSPVELIAIEPYPNPTLKAGLPGLTRLIASPVEKVELELFTSLGAGDILFVDSSHVVRIGGDLNFLFFEILPRLAPGVLVHFHDIFLPYDYPRDWLFEHQWYFTEQYLLQAFLTFNPEFEVLWSGCYICREHEEAVRRAIPPIPGVDLESPRFDGPYLSSAFWIRRKGT